MMRLALALALLGAALCGAALAPTAALADGDPASDYLINFPVYVPFQPPLSRAVARELDRASVRTRATGHEIRAAVIATPSDLGAVPDFFGRPQEYAKFLLGEIKAVYRGGLVVVMPAGFGTAGLPARAARSLAGLQVGSGAGPEALTRAATLAVQRLAAAGGHPIKPVAAEQAAPAAAWGRAALAIVAAALATAGGVALGLGTRARRAAEAAVR